MKKVLLYAVALALAVSGCQSHRTSSPNPQMPQAPMPQPQQPTVWVRGDVKNQIIPWTEELTLARAIAAADYRSVFDPRTILLIRQGQVYKIDPKQLLRGRMDPPLEPGDIVELQH